MDLYTYYRSTSSYRVRIALALKGLDYTALPVNLIAPSGGEHRQPAYLAINPQGRVPALRTDDGELLIQSPAIIEYLEERYPQLPLLPEDLAARGQMHVVDRHRHRGRAVPGGEADRLDDQAVVVQVVRVGVVLVL